ncbi:LysR substrate-binding domain-containing protein [Peteryoungia ipomoeae]|uniref:LysR family transcriptional regulator n=1 Tax=Peteryoungia ipomoeae TaxID=1210932 RepID=A0A4S8P3M5_9HYPH|nr:LysR substrate-binding domain-containing protein [Peteryoungia ipomoeae]THV24051.1 LysR family transcriptional regulator [Peteryoungia ipomoeae]
MKSLRRTLPSLTSLTVFEAAARLGSFTRAADELGVTQAAVSRQIHALEGEFGAALFLRHHRKVVLTDKGRILATAASQAFALLADAASELRREEAEDELTISATVAFSQFWLLPRISRFARAHPEIRLRIVSQDVMPALDEDDVDVAIRFGAGDWPHADTELLFRDEVFPVCSPDFLAAPDQVNSPADLLEFPLISNHTEDPLWMGWQDWLAAFAVVTPRKIQGFRCSFYTEAIYAALNGQGIALGWKQLVEDLLAQKRLIRLTDASVTPKGAYYVVVPRKKQKRSLEVFLGWLRMTIDTQ